MNIFGLHIAGFSLFAHRSNRGRGVLTVWLRPYIVLVVGIGMAVGGIALSRHLCGESACSVKERVGQVFMSLSGFIACIGFFSHRVDYRFSKNTNNLHIRNRGNFCCCKSTTETTVPLRNVVSVDLVQDNVSSNITSSRNNNNNEVASDHLYHLELHCSTTPTLIRFPLEGGSLRKGECEMVRDQIRDFLGIQGLDLEIGGMDANATHASDNSRKSNESDADNEDRDAGGENDVADNPDGGQDADGDGVEFCCEDVECCCCCSCLC